jgi:hypothetical protein
MRSATNTKRAVGGPPTTLAWHILLVIPSVYGCCDYSTTVKGGTHCEDDPFITWSSGQVTEQAVMSFFSLQGCTLLCSRAERPSYSITNRLM